MEIFDLIRDIGISRVVFYSLFLYFFAFTVSSLISYFSIFISEDSTARTKCITYLGPNTWKTGGVLRASVILIKITLKCMEIARTIYM